MWFKTSQNKGSGKDAVVEVNLEDRTKEKNYMKEIRGKYLLCGPRG